MSRGSHGSGGDGSSGQGQGVERVFGNTSLDSLKSSSETGASFCEDSLSQEGNYSWYR